jgi:hypothetical protein
MKDAFQTLGKGNSRLDGLDREAWRKILRWASADATPDEIALAFEYFAEGVALLARPLPPMPVLVIRELTFPKISALFDVLLQRPSKGAHEQFILAALLAATAEEEGTPASHNPPQVTTRMATAVLGKDVLSGGGHSRHGLPHGLSQGGGYGVADLAILRRPRTGKDCIRWKGLQCCRLGDSDPAGSWDDTGTRETARHQMGVIRGHDIESVEPGSLVPAHRGQHGRRERMPVNGPSAPIEEQPVVRTRPKVRALGVDHLGQVGPTEDLAGIENLAGRFPAAGRPIPMRGLRPLRLSRKESHHEEPPTALGHSVIGCFEYSPVNSIPEIPEGLDEVIKGGAHGFSGEARNILQQKCPRAYLADSSYKLRHAIAWILVAEALSPITPGLAGRAARDDVDAPPEIAEVNSRDISGKELSRRMKVGKCRQRIAVPLGGCDDIHAGFRKSLR